MRGSVKKPRVSHTGTAGLFHPSSLRFSTFRRPCRRYALAYDAAGHRLVSGDSRAKVSIRDSDSDRLRTTTTTTNVQQGEINVWSLAIADSPHSILAGNSDGHVYRWIPDDPGWVGSHKGERTATSAEDARVNPTINSVAYNRKYGWVAAGGVGPSVELYDIKDLHRIRSLRGHDGTIWFVTFDPQGSLLAYGGLDGIVRVVDIERMLSLDTDSPGQLYQESQKATGLSVESGRIVQRHAERVK